MSFVAECEQCGVIERGDFETVGDAAEDHEQFHDVRVQRVATDGGRNPDETVELRIRTNRSNLAGIISVYGIGLHHAPAFGPAAGFLEDVLEGMEDVYPQQDRLNDLMCWMGSDAPGTSRDLDVELVELEDDPTDAGDGDDPEDDGPDKDPVDIPITDGGVVDGRYRQQCVDAVRTHAGVGDQDNTCVNDTPGCPGPDAGNGELPCSACFLRGGEADA